MVVDAKSQGLHAPAVPTALAVPADAPTVARV